MKKIGCILSLIIVVGFFYLLIIFFNNYFGERIEVYINKSVENKAVEIINDVLKEEVIPNIDSEKMLLINEKGVIINSKNVNEVLYLVNDNISENFDMIKKEVLKIPLSSIISEELLNFGPNINIRINEIRSFKTDIVTIVEEYGINNSLLKLEILIEFDVESMVPFNKNVSNVKMKIPLVSQIIQGEVPKFYSYGK